MQCARLALPADHDAPQDDHVEVGIMRIPASRAASREGAIFFHFGGPGLHPRDFLPELKRQWSRYDADDELHGGKRLLAERYDFVAVIPRGLDGGTTVACAPIQAAEPEPLGVRLDDATWTAALTYTRALVEACSQHPLARHIDTRQHVGDMEAVRVALGESMIDFVGISYGSFVGLSYASIYPGHLRRILLDSSLDATVGLDRTLQAATADRERIVARLAIGEAVRRPDRWHLGNDRQAIMDRLRRIPASLRVSLMPGIDSPESLIAAFALADTLDDTPGMFATELRASLAKKMLSNDDILDQRIRERLQQMVDALLESPAPISDVAGDQMLAVNIMTLCNDHRWTRRPAEWRQYAQSQASTYATWEGHDVAQGLVCAQWPHGQRDTVQLATLSALPPFLMIHAEYDPSTPLRGAIRLADNIPQAHLVLARDASLHYLLDRTHTPCIEKAASNYLLTGRTPDLKHTSCDAALGH